MNILKTKMARRGLVGGVGCFVILGLIYFVGGLEAVSGFFLWSVLMVVLFSLIFYLSKWIERGQP